jgi:hypothetical protein
MVWLLLPGLGIMWVAFLLPSGRRRPSPQMSVEDFGNDMDLLAHVDGRRHGRWIITPQKGLSLDHRERARAHVRERRRKVFVFLLEAIGLTFLVGLLPPLRIAWGLTAVLGGLLAVYVWMLLSIKARARNDRTMGGVRAAKAPAGPVAPAADPAPRYRAEAATRAPRPTFNGLGALGEGDTVHVVVLPQSETLSPAQA